MPTFRDVYTVGGGGDGLGGGGGDGLGGGGGGGDGLGGGGGDGDGGGGGERLTQYPCDLPAPAAT
jgi:hypothetical protein